MRRLTSVCECVLEVSWGSHQQGKLTDDEYAFACKYCACQAVKHVMWSCGGGHSQLKQREALCELVVWFFFVKRPKNANKVQQLTTEISLNYKLTWKVESAAVRVAACGNGSEKLLKRNIYSQQTLCRANMTVIIAAKQKYKIFQFFCCCFFQRSTRVCRPYALWRAPCVGELLLWSLTLCG